MEISSTTSLPSIQAVPDNSETPTAFSEKLECNTQGTLFVESEIPARDNVPYGPSLEQNLHVPTENSDQPKPIIENIVFVAESSKSVDSPSSSSSNLSVVQSSDSGSIVTSSNGSSEIHRTVVLESAISAEHSVLDDPTLDQNQYVPTQNTDRLEAKVENILAESSKEDDSPASSSSGTSVAGLIDGGSIVNLSNGSGEIGASEDKLQILSSDEPHQSHEVVISVQNQMVGLSAPSGPVKQAVVHRALVDTTAPFESVKEAVTKFGGIVDWKAHKLQTVERRKYVEFELEKAQEEVPKYKKQTEAAESAKVQVLKELDKTKRLIEELKLNLEKAQTEENQAKQDSELAQLRVKEIEQGIADESSVAAKTQLEVAKARHNAAVTELKSVRDELEALKHQHASLVNVRDLAVKKAEEAVSSSKEVEKTVEELTLELIMAKESLESTQTAHLEAEEHRIAAAMAKEQDEFNWQRELKEAEEEVQKLNEKLESTKELKSKLDSASQLLLNLKAELATYMQSKLAQETENMEKEDTLREELEEAEKTHTSINAAIALAKQEIEEVRVRIEKAKEDVKCLRVAAVSLKLELEKEKAALMSMRQREGMALVAVASLEAELNEAKSQMELVHIKEKETREKMVELPKALQQAAQEADQAKTLAKLAREEHRKAREKAEQVKAGATTMESRLLAALKEIEAAKASERLALAAVKALQESESVAEPDSPGGVTLSLEDYYELSKRAHEAEEHASIRVTAAIAQIGVARESEFRSLNKLKEASREMDERKEALRKATEKAEKAKEGKLGVEQELRKWRADHEKRRKAADAGPGAVNPNRSPQMSFEERKELKVGDLETAAMQVHQVPSQKVFISRNENVESMPDLKVKSKKKKSLFPRIIMFWARKRAQSK